MSSYSRSFESGDVKIVTQAGRNFEVRAGKPCCGQNDPNVVATDFCYVEEQIGSPRRNGPMTRRPSGSISSAECCGVCHVGIEIEAL